MMSWDKVFIPIRQDIYQELLELAEQLKHDQSKAVSKALGANLTNLTCEILHQVFGVLITSEITGVSKNQVNETIQAFEQVEQQLKRYMPWSISLFANDRLFAMTNYLLDQFILDQSQRIFVQFNISDALAQRVQQNFEHLDIGHPKCIHLMFEDLVEVIDTGVDVLIRQPKAILNCNFVLSKTLDGVIHFITTLGYKRIHKVADCTSTQVAQHYAQHFYGFLRPIS